MVQTSETSSWSLFLSHLTTRLSAPTLYHSSFIILHIHLHHHPTFHLNHLQSSD
jgi:hypothetical protein